MNNICIHNRPSRITEHGQPSSSEVKSEGCNSSDRKEIGARDALTSSSQPVVIDLTQSSDEDSDIEDLYSDSESDDSDLEIISHRSRSPLTNSDALVGHTAPLVAITSADIAGVSAELPAPYPQADSRISIVENGPSRSRFSIPLFSPVTNVAIPQTRNATDNAQTMPISGRSFHRPRDDVVDWLNEIEPFNPVSNISMEPSSSCPSHPVFWGTSIDRSCRVHCANCGHSVRIEHSINDQSQPSTSARHPTGRFPPLRSFHERIRSNHREYMSSNQSVLERMLSTPPLPVLDEHHQRGASVNNAQTGLSSDSAASFSPYHTQLQQLALNFAIPPPAHTGNVTSVASGSDFTVGSRFRNEIPVINFSSNTPLAPEISANVIPAAAHGGANHIYQNTVLPSLRPDLLSHLTGNGRLHNHSQHNVPIHQAQQIDPIFGQSQRVDFRQFHQQTFGQSAPFIINPPPMDFLPASVFLQGFYPDFPGFGLSSTQIERHTVKYVLEKPSHADTGEATAAKRPKASYADENEATCSVCLEGFDAGQTLRRLTCQHLFHADCVDEWLRRRPTCPNCRVDVRRVTNNSNAGEPTSSAAASTFDRQIYFPQNHRHQRLWPFISNHQ